MPPHECNSAESNLKKLQPFKAKKFQFQKWGGQLHAAPHFSKNKFFTVDSKKFQRVLEFSEKFRKSSAKIMLEFKVKFETKILP